MFMTTLILSFMHSHTLKTHLVHTDEERDIKQKIEKVSVKSRKKTYIGSATYLASVPLAYASVYLSYVCFIIAVILFLLPAGIDEERLADKVIEKNS